MNRWRHAFDCFNGTKIVFYFLSEASLEKIWKNRNKKIRLAYQSLTQLTWLYGEGSIKHVSEVRDTFYSTQNRRISTLSSSFFLSSPPLSLKQANKHFWKQEAGG